MIVIAAANYVSSLKKANLRINRIRYIAYVNDGGVKSTPRITVSSTNNTPVDNPSISLSKPKSTAEMRVMACFLYCVANIGKAHGAAVEILFTTRRGDAGYDDAITTKHQKKMRSGKLQNKFDSILRDMAKESDKIVSGGDIEIPSHLTEVCKAILLSAMGDGTVNIVSLNKIRNDHNLTYYDIYLEYRNLLDDDLIDNSLLPKDIHFPTLNFDEFKIELEERVKNLQKQHSNRVEELNKEIESLSVDKKELFADIEWLNSRTLWNRIRKCFF